MAVLIVLVGIGSVLRAPTDIFPSIDIPVIAVVWPYKQLPPDEMAGRIMTPFEQSLTQTVNNVEHIEGRSVNGYGIVKIYFQPSVNIATANAQVTAIAQTKLSDLPQGTTPPYVLNYRASTVPILQLALSDPKLTEQKLRDLGLTQIRPQLATTAGASVPYPYGGKSREVRVDIDPARLAAYNLSAADVTNALLHQNLITPIGTEKIGPSEYTLRLNNSPKQIADLNKLPIKEVDGTVVRMEDIGHVLDGSPPQRNVVHVNGQRSVLLQVLKNGDTSTLAIVSGVKQRLKQIKDSLPSSLKIDPIADQSQFVRASIEGVVEEGLIAAALTSLMILLFLGSWRSTVIIAISIPLSILSSIIALTVLGETLNIMTLGGLALAVGILVDDATVTIENINYHLEKGKNVRTAIFDGAGQIVKPLFVSLACICVVFVPMFFLGGVSGYLFVPLAEAVIFTMIASFILSRTLVPTLAAYLIQPFDEDHEQRKARSRNPLTRFQLGFARRFESFRSLYRGVLTQAIEHRVAFVVGFMILVVASFALVPGLGRNFFPKVDAGEITMHVRVPVGTRIGETAKIFAHIRDRVRQIIPADQIETIVDNIGLTSSGINTAYNNTGTVGSYDGDIQISLATDHDPTQGFVTELRNRLPREFPQATFSFPPADIVSQTLNFGSPAPMSIQIRGQKLDANYDYAESLLPRLKRIPGIADVRIQESRSNPEFGIDVDRDRAQLLGITMAEVSNTLRTNLAGSGQINRTFWLDPKKRQSYPIVVQTPQYQLNSLAALKNLPIKAADGSTHVLGAIATVSRQAGNAVFDQYNTDPLLRIYAATNGRDLGSVSDAVQKILDQTTKDVPKGSQVQVAGQVTTMNTAFTSLFWGIAGAMLLIYLLIVVNFQSWLDPFVIITALPAALAGIVWMLFATGTGLSVPALTGAIMALGVATSNSVLVVAFAREQLAEHGDAVKAAIEAGTIRFRPVLMTALALMIGMLPMSLALSAGSEQNAPLGRALIGGLIFATVATLLFVPVIFAMIHGRRGGRSPSPASADDPSFYPPARQADQHPAVSTAGSAEQ
ncbi:efflux RND transporter permease subunit [Salinisphaera sp. SPP-AMP-43]|uniref:efflux RND transporter permease subunit n=1 Tax=Salinisphaera sp. SPP-AMP-43 TaxID=3121288 RepID=UPI003C6E0446